MDSLMELIDNRIGKALANSDCVNSQIGQVLAINDNSYDVKLFTTGSVYTLPNYSGSDLNENELVQVYWRGGFLSNQTAYIGAALTKDAPMNYLPCDISLVTLSSASQIVAEVYFTAKRKTTVILYFNAVIDADTSDDVTFTIYLDGTALSYTPQLTTVEGFNHCAFTLPVSIETVGNHELEVTASGTGSIAQIESFIEGHVIPYINPNPIVTRTIDFYLNTTTLEGDVGDLSVYQNMKRCNVADNGTINAFYGDTGYTEDGTNGQVMVYVKKFYYKMTPTNLGDSDNRKILAGSWSISDVPHAGYKLHPAFLAEDGTTEVDYFLFGAFDAVGQDGNGNYSNSYNTTSYKLASIGGNTMSPMGNVTRVTSETMARNRGNGWHAMGIKQLSAIQMLIGVEFTFNVSKYIGYGIVSDSAIHNTGETTGNTTSGTRDNKTTATNYRGIENLWSNVLNDVQGVNVVNTTMYICDTYNYVEATTTGYTAVKFAMPVSTGTPRWVSEFGYDADFDWLFIPKDTPSGTLRDTPIGNKLWDARFNGNYVLRMGGHYTVSEGQGVTAWFCDTDASGNWRDSGTRLMYIPQS